MDAPAGLRAPQRSPGRGVTRSRDPGDDGVLAPVDRHGNDVDDLEQPAPALANVAVGMEREAVARLDAAVAPGVPGRSRLGREDEPLAIEGTARSQRGELRGVDPGPPAGAKR